MCGFIMLILFVVAFNNKEKYLLMINKKESATSTSFGESQPKL